MVTDMNGHMHKYSNDEVKRTFISSTDVPVAEQ